MTVSTTQSAPSETWESLQAEIIQTGTQPLEPDKRGPGRPKKEAEIVPPEFLDPLILAEIVSMPFDLIAERKQAPHWKLTNDEKARIAMLASKVISKYAPLWLSKFGDELALGLSLSFVILARISADREIQQRKAPIINSGSLDPDVSGQRITN